MIEIEHADVKASRKLALSILRPPPDLTLSQWADEHFYLSQESAAVPGRWKTLPYQREIMDAMTDPRITFVTVMKSARVGYTKMLNALIGYSIQHDPCSMLLVQPTVDGAKIYSKEEIKPMLRDCPGLASIKFNDVEDKGPKGTGDTILHKEFPGGVLSMVGANSGSGFRSISRKRVIFDEVDAYPLSAGSDGDPIRLGTKRAEYFWDRKIIAGSTPLLEGVSRIAQMFQDGDQRRYHVPCPQCDHMAPLVFSGESGHAMTWPEGRPEDAFFSCQENGCVIEHKDKRLMIERGEWIAAGEFSGHASFHIWAAYSYSPNASWGAIAKEFLSAKQNVDLLKTFVNTTLGETWKERGDAPDWERLYGRRETYTDVPPDVKFLTCGVDVQKDRFVYEVVGWGADKVSWSIEAGVIPVGSTSDELAWLKLDELLNQSWTTSTGAHMAIRMLAVDSGFNTQMVYSWARRNPARVLACKGVSTAKTLLSSPTPVDVTFRGQKIARGCKVWPIGVSIAKAELYGWLRLPTPDAGGYCHFPEHGPDYFKQLTGEQLVSVANKRTGFTSYEWQLVPGRENHYLDARVYARAAAAQCGLDLRRAPRPSAPPSSSAAPRQISDSEKRDKRVPRPGGWLSKRR
jgi:phage terminase large subunit GpA-like protein